MKYRPLGETGLSVSELGLGCSAIGSSVFNNLNDDDSIDLLKYAFDNGINFFDTASTYTFGNSEKLIGKAFRGCRDKVIISSKVGFLDSSLARYGRIISPFISPFRKFILPHKKKLKKISKKRQDFSKEYILNSIEKSLTRLNTDYVDLYLLHNPPAEIITEGNVFERLEKLKREGKIRNYGISAGSMDEAKLALKNKNISALQIEFNMLATEAVNKLFTLDDINKVGIIAKIPFARGLLTNHGEQKTGMNYISDSEIEMLKNRRNNLKKIVENKNRNLSQAALKFILAHKEMSTAIPGTRSILHLEANIKSLSAPDLTGEELELVYKNG